LNFFYGFNLRGKKKKDEEKELKKRIKLIRRKDHVREIYVKGTRGSQRDTGQYQKYLWRTDQWIPPSSKESGKAV
jgi:hypothetical protein